MLKPKDIVVLLKLLANPHRPNIKQKDLAKELCMSVSEINKSLTRLAESRLLQEYNNGYRYHPIVDACEEFIFYGLRYGYPAKRGCITSGVPTSYAAPVLIGFTKGSDPIPVWPYVEGKERGMSLEPLYPSVPKSVSLFPDNQFYDLLCLVDILRDGNSREREHAMKLLKCYFYAVRNSSNLLH